MTGVQTCALPISAATSKIKPIAQKMTSIEMGIATIFGLLPFVGFVFLVSLSYWVLGGIILLLIFTRYRLVAFFNKNLGGYTGDCLGAVQQVTEVVFYLSLLALPQLAKLWNNFTLLF